MITTEGKTREEVYTEIMQELIRQGKQCKTGNKCMYSDKSGNHCAAGWLLPDGFRYAGSLPMLVMKKNISLEDNEKFIKDNADDLHKLQLIHDRPDLFVRYAVEFIEKYPTLKTYIDEWLEITNTNEFFSKQNKLYYDLCESHWE